MNGRIPFFPFNCLGFTPSAMKDFIFETLGPALHEAGYTKEKLKLFVGDDQRTYMKFYLPNILSDKRAEKYVSGIAFHWY